MLPDSDALESCGTNIISTTNAKIVASTTSFISSIDFSPVLHARGYYKSFKIIALPDLRC